MRRDITRSPPGDILLINVNARKSLGPAVPGHRFAARLRGGVRLFGTAPATWEAWGGGEAWGH
jgi:hypothetical protein